MENEKDEIIYMTFYKNWHELAKKYNLTMQQYGELVYALNEYCFYNKTTELKNSVSDIIYQLALPIINKSNKSKTSGAEGGKNAKGKSGAPKGNQNASKKKQ